MILPVTIAGKELLEFDAKMQSYPEISSCEVDASIFQGTNRSSLQLISNRRGQRTLKCKIDFFGDNFNRTLHQSEFEALFLGSDPVIIDICDGFWYRAVLSDIGDPSTDHELITTVEYSFVVTRHLGDEITIDIASANDIVFNCESNVAKTDCIISLCAQYSDAKSVDLVINGYTFTVTGGFDGDLVLNGVDKIFLINGANAASRVKWTDFPFLIPGENHVNIYVEGVVPSGLVATIRYTPTFL